jgi:hypothetical protein
MLSACKLLQQQDTRIGTYNLMKLTRMLTAATTLVVATMFSGCGGTGDESQESDSPPGIAYGSAEDVSST